jgi:hypothetical protein
VEARWRSRRHRSRRDAPSSALEGCSCSCSSYEGGAQGLCRPAPAGGCTRGVHQLGWRARTPPARSGVVASRGQARQMRPPPRIERPGRASAAALGGGSDSWPCGWASRSWRWRRCDSSRPSASRCAMGGGIELLCLHQILRPISFSLPQIERCGRGRIS